MPIGMMPGRLMSFPSDCYIVLARNGTKGGYTFHLARDEDKLRQILYTLQQHKRRILVMQARPLVKYVRIKRKGMEIWREYTEFRRPQHEKG